MTVGFGNAEAEGGRVTRWLTPRYIVDALGEFDLDPCGAPGYELASRTYLLESGDDGLRDEWFGRVWLNPPYGSEAAPFMARMKEHGVGTLLIFARTETRAFFDYVWGGASAMFFIKGRVKFLRPDLSQGESANAPSVLVAYGDMDAEALRACGLPGKFIDLRGQ